MFLEFFVFILVFRDSSLNIKKSVMKFTIFESSKLKTSN